MAEPDDLKRLRREYAERERRLSGTEHYSSFYSPFLFAIQQRQRDLLKGLQAQGINSLCGKRILEVGCGAGGVLQDYLWLGADRGQLFGIDLLPDRLREAHIKIPEAGILCGDGQNLPFPAESFDLVLQYTAFSSVLDEVIKQQMAGDMLRVVKRNGAIIWYDFWINPTNPQTRGISPREIKNLFRGSSVKAYKITLAPPIARRVIPFSWLLGMLLENLKFFNSHYLAIIRKG